MNQTSKDKGQLNQPVTNHTRPAPSKQYLLTLDRLDFSSVWSMLVLFMVGIHARISHMFVLITSQKGTQLQMDKEWTFLNTFQFSGVFPWTKSRTSQGQENRTATPTQIVWQLQGQRWLCCWCHKQRRWRAVDPAAPTKTAGWKAVSRLGIPWSPDTKLLDTAELDLFWRDLIFEDDFIVTSRRWETWQSLTIRFHPTWTPSRARSIAACPKASWRGPKVLIKWENQGKRPQVVQPPGSELTWNLMKPSTHRMLRYVTIDHPSPATQNLNTTLPYFIHWFAAWTSTHTSVSASHTVTTTTNST